ncbi:hypothetical protein M9H77_12245 [Catharanthus roseus]|uniref:Uncharacterized protein n=1 Tax=Catharanthus roseus TaxID=4058 RepID=A0ACC0BGT9_CATRO|nr:hypothetical protein M9H77_12245 [Catharanthus roseus]
MNDADDDVQQEESDDDVDSAIMETDGEFDEETTIFSKSTTQEKESHNNNQIPFFFFFFLHQPVTLPLAGSYGKSLAREVRYENFIDRINLELKISGISDAYCRDAELFYANYSSSSPW